MAGFQALQGDVKTTNIIFLEKIPTLVSRRLFLLFRAEMPNVKMSMFMKT